MRKISLLTLCVLGMSLFCGPDMRARADVLPPEAEACEGKKSGDACEGGVCRKQTCSKLDYENWDRDAEASPPTKEYECLQCGARDAGSAPDSGDDDAGCSTAGELGGQGAALSFALFMGVFLGGRWRRKRA